MLKRIIKLTNDGSPTIYNATVNECYHSIFGAIQESQHVFIKNGFELIKKQHLNVFEMGFGTGLNAFLTLVSAEENNITTFYDAIELYPLENKIINELSYEIKNSIYNNKYNEIHNANWGEYNEISPHYYLRKIKANILEYEFEKTYDVVYFDSFSPEKQPELWTYEVFKKIFNNIQINGILTTYCAKGIVKRTLKSVGFEVNLVEGPPGKRQMIIAIKTNPD